MTAHQSLTPTDIRLAMHERGYRPVPVSSPTMNVDDAGKAPLMKDWRAICLDASPEEIKRWGTAERNCTNTGILCGTLVGVDIDVRDAALSENIERRALELLGHTPLRRVGRAPKVLLAYRLALPIKKMQTTALQFTNDPDEKDTQVEVLAQGQHFVGFGVHPDTRQPYSWDDASPLTINFDELPETTEEAIRQFVAEAEAILRAAGASTFKQDRKKAEKQAQEPPKHTTSERASASARERGPRDGSDFWRTVNDRALANLSAWVPSVFPSARFQSSTGAYRVDQRDLGEGYEEDLSLHPDGIRDFGCGDMGDARDGARTPIDIVRDYLPASSARAAAMWLCERLGTRPEDIGWKGSKRNDSGAFQEEAAAQAAPGERKRIRATPFVYRDPSLIPPREWVYGRHLIRRFLSTTVAPGAVGKSSLVLVEAIAMVTGRPLLGVMPVRCMRVWYVNLERFPPTPDRNRRQRSSLRTRLG